MTYHGEAAALATAMLWTGSSLAFAASSRRAGGMATNQFRLLLAVPCLWLLCLLLLGAPWQPMPAPRLRDLVLSGVAGLVLGDAAYFYALARIGPRVSSVLMATWPAMATAIGFATGQQRPDAAVLLGIALTLGGVVLVLLRGGGSSAWNPGLRPFERRLAILGALGGALGQAVAVLLSRPAMAAGPDLTAGVPPLWAAFVRMLAASAGILLLARCTGQPFQAGAVWRDGVARRAALAGTVCGPILGVWMSMVAVRDSADTGTAAALMSTTPIFMMPLARWLWGARIGLRGVLGTVLAVGGAGVLLTARP